VLPVFRKNIYTKEIIDFIMERLNNKEKTKFEIMKEYGIPKSTLYKWIHKYNDKP
jgi:transposase-like protein